MKFRISTLCLIAFTIGCWLIAIRGAQAQAVTVLHDFGDGSVPSDGASPDIGLVQGPNGSFYGTTSTGGSANQGTVFEISPQGQMSIIHNFSDGTVPNDGILPQGIPLVLARDGNLYGTTIQGGSATFGTVYRITPAGQVTILHSFGDGTVSNDGKYPLFLMQASDGNFYGTTQNGGAAGNGTVFKITVAGAVTILHSFGDGTVTNDGATPYGLTQGVDGNFYGTTIAGGSTHNSNGGYGTFYEMTPAGGVTILHNFSDGSVTNDGVGPYDPPTQAADGNFYVTTANGGSTQNLGSNIPGLGAFLKITPQGVVTLLHSFADGTVANDGTLPSDRIILGSNGCFYGTTGGGGSSGHGVVYQATPQGQITILHSFQDGILVNDGASESNSNFGCDCILQAADGKLYGTTPSGGSSNVGVVYRLAPHAPVITSALSVSGNVALPFRYQITGTLFPHIFTSTSLPNGLSLSATGVISGTPTDVGTTTVTLTLANGSDSSTYPITISIAPLPLPAVTSILTAYGSVGAAFTYNAIANNNTTSYAATGLDGTGLSLDPATGIISGTPTTVGTINADITPTNATGAGAPSTLVIKIFASPPTLSQEYNLVHAFGDGPLANVPKSIIQGFDGNFYGVSQEGGTGYGAVYKTSIQGTTSLLYSFTNPGVFFPDSLIQAADGSFYGTTSRGQVFRLTLDGQLTLVYDFGTAAQLNPLVQGLDGNLYGTSLTLGTANAGEAFMLTPAGVLTVLHNFQDGSANQGADGRSPSALIQATDGNFYGTCNSNGDNDNGTVFKMTPQGAVTNLHSFPDSSVGNDGIFPDSGVIQGTDGNFYGTTRLGGSAGAGTAYKMTPQGLVTIIHSFGQSAGDGSNPRASLIEGTDGNFYGTTLGEYTGGLDILFEITPSGDETIIHTFAGSNSGDGLHSETPLIQSGAGNFYGITVDGGDLNQGTLFSVIPSQAPTHKPIFTGSAYATSSLYTPFSYTPTAFFGVSGSGAETGNAVQAQSGGGFMADLISLLPQIIRPSAITTSWALTGTLPTALDFDNTSGTISGTPTQSGTYQLSIKAHNALGDSAPQVITLYIDVPPGVSSPLSANAVVGTAFNYQITTVPSALSYGASNLPDWLTPDTVAGTITGIPPAAGHYIFDAIANNDSGQTIQPITLSVTGGTAVPVLTSATTATGTAGTPFTYKITASPAATSSAVPVLPAGLQFDAPTSTILGTPTAPGVFQIPITTTNATGSYAAILTLTVAPPAAPTLPTPLNIRAAQGYAFSFGLPTTSVVATYSETGALPDGLTLNTATGVISGTPTETGTFPISVTATNVTGASTSSLTLTTSNPSDFSDWSQTYHFSGEPTDMTYGDGVPNLLKYLYDINPTRPMTATDRAALPKVASTSTAGGNVLTLTFREYASAVISPAIQTSTDLQNWGTPTTYTIIQTGTDATTGDPIMQAQVPVTSAHQFIRLQAISP